MIRFLQVVGAASALLLLTLLAFAFAVADLLGGDAWKTTRGGDSR